MQTQLQPSFALLHLQQQGSSTKQQYKAAEHADRQDRTCIHAALAGHVTSVLVVQALCKKTHANMQKQAQ
jgi:hypothetical protein